MDAPDSSAAPVCAHTARQQAALASDNSTFAPALKLLPRDMRADVKRLYLVLRTLDDLVDEERPQAAERLDAVERWARKESADSPETRMLDQLAQLHTISAAPLLDFCRGMRHDLAHATVHTEEDLERYCQRAGGSVGIILADILGTIRTDGREKMAMLGRAMQRTNILRDIDEDAAHGHLYIAKSTIERFGLPRPGRRAELLRDQIAKADRLYQLAADAPSLLARGKRAMALSAALYREILRQIERNGYGRLHPTTTVPAWRRRMLIARHRLRPYG